MYKELCCDVHSSVENNRVKCRKRIKSLNKKKTIKLEI